MIRTMHNQPPPIVGLHHVAIHVNDLEEAATFYTEVIGLKEINAPSNAKSNRIRWFDVGDGKALHMMEAPVNIPENRAHFAITVEDIDGWRSYLESKGVEVHGPRVEVYSAERVFMRDPSGNLFELVKWLD